MNKGISKWPSKVLNLLVVLSMVIALCAVLATPVAAQEEECNLWHEYQGCHLTVAVNTYVKNESGAFSSHDSFTPGESFYVNAVVTNDGNATALGPITAVISWPDSGIILATGEGNYTKTWAGNLTGSSPAGANAIADFWWLVTCNSANGSNKITVTATSASQCDVRDGAAAGCAYVTQGTTDVPECLDIEIVEAPGMGDVVGQKLDGQGNPVVYHSSLSNTVSPCTTFGIKAELTNNCTCPLPITDLYAWINISGQATVLDPLSWPVGTNGTLAPGETASVGWMLHCDDVGNGIVDIKVNATGVATCPVAISGPLDDITYGDNTWRVYQTTPGGLAIEITDPTPEHDCNGKHLPINIPTGCNQNRFTVTAKVTNTGNNALNNVSVYVERAPASGWVELPELTSHDFGSLAGHGSQSWTFGNFTCIGNGTGTITASASANGVATVHAGTNDPVTITQKDVIASIAPVVLDDETGEPDWPITLPVNPGDVNQCQEFGVAFRYSNYLAVPWDLSGGNITACINWAGNTSAELVGPAYYRRVESGIAGPWELLPGFAGGNNTSGQYCERIPYTESSPVICPCCALDILWVFQCKEANHEVMFNSTISVQQGGSTYTDRSEPLCVDQNWKAHLTSSVLFFVQDPVTGVMTNQGAVVPGTDFHVVIPVVNTGGADAEDVQVYFTLTGAPTGSFTYEGHSGDVVSMDHTPGSQIFTAHLGTIYGTDSCGANAKKIILLLKCNGQGEVDVTIPTAKGGNWASQQTDKDGKPLTVAKGVRGYDENSGTWVPQANIVVPNCPEILYQIPFTVVMENPISCQSYNQWETFPVKALITNGGTVEIDGVIATINISGNATMSAPGNATLLDPQQKWTDGYGVHGNKLVGNISAGRSYEATWMVQCTGAGDVYINVSATLPSPKLTATTPTTVVVHQIPIPTACLNVFILSPDEHQVGQDWDVGRKHAMIATGQQFAVTAKISNGEYSSTAEGVMVDINPVGCDSLHYVTLVDPETEVQGPYTIPGNSSQIVTWTLYGGSEHDFWMRGCSAVNDTICVNATMTTTWATNCPSERQGNATDSVDVSVYPAAFLVATMDISPSTTAVLGDEFTVDYTITNYGVADATTVVATLAADNSNVHLAAGTGGWSQAKSTIAGWSFGEPYNSVSGSFTLVGTAQGLSTLTITPTGEDECGWHALVGEECEEGNNDGDYWECEPQYNWVQFGLLPIQSRFLILDSETVALSATGACPDVTSVNITLKSGWNLMSLPLIPNNGAIGTVLSGISSHVNSVYYYDGANWLSWSPGVGGSLSTMDQKKAYWINMKTDSAQYTLTENGSVGLPPPGLPTTIDVAAGWNMIGFKSTCARAAGSYLSGVPWVRIWSFTNGAWSAVNSSDKMQPGLGYWIAATSVGTIFP